MSIFLYILIFTAVALAVAGVSSLAALALFPDAARVRRRVEEEFQKEANPVRPSPVFKDIDRLRFDADVTPSVDAALSTEAETSWGSRLDELLERADVGMTRPQVIGGSIGLGIVLGLVGLIGWNVLVGALALAIGLAGPWLYVFRQASVRREKLLMQLPAAFELMSRVLRAGQSAPQALIAVADTFEQPLAGLFASCQKQQGLGLTPEVSYRALADKAGVLEARIFVMAMLIQRQTGGNLAEVLDRLAQLLRERARLRKHVRSLTAEGRLQGLTLFCLPFIVFAALMAVNRDYAEVLLEHPQLIGLTGATMVVGLLWIRKIINFEF